MKPYRPSKIYIEKDAVDFAHTQKILKNLSDVPVEEVENAASLKSLLAEKNDPIGEG